VSARRSSLSLSLSLPGGLGAALTKVFFGIGLALPILTGTLSILFIQLGLMTRVEVYPWDNVLSDLYFLTLFVTPESICVYLFQNKVIKRFLARMGYAVILVFVYANYVLLPPSTYSFLPETPATLVWALWPAIIALALGFVVGKIESKEVLGERFRIDQSA
jgi:hypothetical protein